MRAHVAELGVSYSSNQYVGWLCRPSRRVVLASAVRQYKSIAKATSQLEGTCKKDPTRKASSIDAEKEASRKFRRTHFDINDWKVHRSTNRYWRHVKSGFLSSRIVKGLAAPLLYVAVLSTAVCGYESALALHTLPDWGFQWPSISMASSGAFSLSTFALSLLLVFRTNSSYQRWCEARRMWGLLINRSRDLARQVLQWFPEHRDAALSAAACRWISAFPVVLMCSLRDDVQLKPLVEPLLLPHELELLLKQPHPGTGALQALGACVKNSGASRVEKLRIDENITVLQDVMGVCERIFRTPIPLSYTRHTSRFLVCWLTCLPFCVADSMGWMTVPIAVGLAFFLFGIEEIGVQIEEPFGILALEVFCANIIKNVRQAETAAAAMQEAVDLDILAAGPLGISHPLALETLEAVTRPIGSLNYDVMVTSSRASVDLADYELDTRPANGNGANGATGYSVGISNGRGGHLQSHRMGVVGPDAVGAAECERNQMQDMDRLSHTAYIDNPHDGGSSRAHHGSRAVSPDHNSNGNGKGPSYPLKPRLGDSASLAEQQAASRPTSKQQGSLIESSIELKRCDSGDDVYLGMSIGAAAPADDSSDVAF